jgi:hypothetical protein
MTRTKGGDGRWRVRGVSVQGYSHLRDGVECQDAHRHAYEPETGSYVLAVADGAGSRPRSAEGATVAAGLAVSVLVDALGRTGLPDSPEAWRAWLGARFEAIVHDFLENTQRLGGRPADFAATLTVAVLAPPWLGTASLGDGIVIVGAAADDGPALHLIAHTPPAGEYVNETHFLSSQDALRHTRVQVLHDPGLTALLLATDGIAPIGVERGEREARRPNVSFLGPVLDSLSDKKSDPAEVTRLLLQDRISRLSADDKTLLAAVRT